MSYDALHDFDKYRRLVEASRTPCHRKIKSTVIRQTRFKALEVLVLACPACLDHGAFALQHDPDITQGVSEQGCVGKACAPRCLGIMPRLVKKINHAGISMLDDEPRFRPRGTKAAASAPYRRGRA